MAAAGADLFIAESNFFDKQVAFHMNLKALTVHLGERDFVTAEDGKIIEI